MKAVILCCGLPCPARGGSPWHFANLSKYGPKTRAKIMKHRRICNNIWKSFEVVVRDCVEHGCKVAMEWPASCFYWRCRKVERFFKDYGLSKSRFDGCMDGLLSCRPGFVRAKLKKPWAKSRLDNFYLVAKIGFSPLRVDFFPA